MATHRPITIPLFTSPLLMNAQVSGIAGSWLQVQDKFISHKQAEIYALKSHVVNFCTELIRSGQPEERTTFSKSEKHRLSNQRP